mgnify:FL=1
MTIHTHTRKVWRAPTARRDYLTKWGACVAEARARIKKRYPGERSSEFEPGWSWHSLPRSETLLKRYARVIFRSLTP